jgi:hypothetical protein
MRRARVWLIARLAGTGSATFVATQSGTTTGSYVQTVLFGRPGGEKLSTPHETELLPQNLGSFEIFLSCSATSTSPCYPANPRPLELKGVEVTLEEYVPPVIQLRGGTVTTPGAQSGVRSVSYTVRDEESGVAKVEGLLGDTVVGAKSFAAECRHADFNACPTGRSDELSLNTRLVPNGSHAFRLRVTDAAGNRVAAQAPDVVKVVNGANATSQNRLAARFLSTRRSTATTRYGRSVIVSGRLTNSGGYGIAKANVEVLERRSMAGKKTIRATRISTRSDGKFRYRVSSRGPSRSIRLQYRTKVDNADDVATRTLTLRVRAASSLRVTLNGVNVRYGGKVSSTPLPRGGKLVLIQGRVVGGTWQTFATRRTSRRGRFSGRYRLRVHRPGVRLQFRVRVPTEAGYPYAAGSGRALTRRVR